MEKTIFKRVLIKLIYKIPLENGWATLKWGLPLNLITCFYLLKVSFCKFSGHLLSIAAFHLCMICYLLIANWLANQPWSVYILCQTFYVNLDVFAYAWSMTYLCLFQNNNKAMWLQSGHNIGGSANVLWLEGACNRQTVWLQCTCMLTTWYDMTWHDMAWHFRWK